MAKKIHMPLEEFLEIKSKLGVTYDVMAADLGLSKRGLQLYREGKTAISQAKAMLFRAYAKSPDKFKG